MAAQKRQNTSAQIIDYILAKIESGELQSGDKLTNERALALELGVSRVPLREAICALSTLGILEARQGGGTFVSRYNPALVGKIIKTYSLFDRSLSDEVFSARMLLESDAARLAALNRSDQDLTLLRFTLNKYDMAVHTYRGAPEELQKIAAYDSGVHLGVARASHNNFFVQLIDTIRSVKGAVSPNADRLPEKAFLIESSESHERIFRAIEEKNCPAAHEAMQAHLLEFYSARG